MKKDPKNFAGTQMGVAWDGRLCIHLEECVRSDGELFVTGRRPWCLPDPSSEEDIMDVVGRCSSGAPTYRDKAGTGWPSTAFGKSHHQKREWKGCLDRRECGAVPMWSFQR